MDRKDYRYNNLLQGILNEQQIERVPKITRSLPKTLFSIFYKIEKIEKKRK